MGIKNNAINWAGKNNVSFKSWQSGKLRDIERDFENGKIDEEKALGLIERELVKADKYLKGSERTSLKKELF